MQHQEQQVNAVEQEIAEKQQAEANTKPVKCKTKRTLIGGQALMEGVMMRSSKNMALAVRDPNGNILIDAKKVKGGNRWYKKVPILRGMAAFVGSLIMSVSTLLKSAEVMMSEDDGKESATDAKKSSKGMGVLMAFSMILGLALGIGLFFAVPFLISNVIENHAPHMNEIWRQLIEGGIRIVIFVAYLALVAALRDIRRMFGYHGAEHRVISCFEKDLPLTTKNIQSCSTRHNRCGTSFLFFVMVIAIFVFSLVTWGTNAIITNQVGYTWSTDLYAYRSTTLNDIIENNVLAFLARFGIRMALLPIVAGLSFELLRFLAWLPDNKVTAVLTWPLRAPGLALQRLTTYIPDDDMVEVARAAFLEVQAMDDNPNLKGLEFGQFRYLSLREYVDEKLAVVNAEICETDWIFVEVTGYKRNELSKLKIITFEQYKRIASIVKERTGKDFVTKPVLKNFCGPMPKFDPKPLWQVIGHTDFYGERVVVTKAVLTPRLDTEILAHEAIKAAEQKMEQSRTGEVSVLDLCAGSGCIALAISKNTNATVTASDICNKALEVARQNLENRDNVEVLQSDLFNNLQGKKFDIIVSNPPYIKSADIDTLAPEVKNSEPHLALDGGNDGLDFYRRIIDDVKNHLNPGGILLLEIGINQAQDVVAVSTKIFKQVDTIKDLQGIDRVVKATL